MKLLFPRRYLGFTLVEALVALVVLVVGVLGLASMQLKAMQGAHVSYQRSVATMAAQDMVERLWIQLGMQGVGSDVVTCPDDGDTLLIKNPDYDPDVAGENPTEPVEPVKTVFDYWYEEWVQILPTLVEASTEVVKESATCRYTITVVWGDERFAGEDVSQLVYKTSIISGS
ncbi:type IV pilus modification protein PilV [Halomonas denitrificans]|uniref:type IV pilus modification protein PilV n=1 Tax=Halomonas denitrificans TaxID=370769 RepID=UPI000DF2EA0B|nr:type IV pilus modification protein PilV [Halomonas denitrificans]